MKSELVIASNRRQASQERNLRAEGSIMTAAVVAAMAIASVIAKSIVHMAFSS